MKKLLSVFLCLIMVFLMASPIASAAAAPKLAAIYNSANGADIRWKPDNASAYVIMRKANGVWKEIKTVYAADLEENGGTYKYIDGSIKGEAFYGKGYIYSVAVKEGNNLIYDTVGLPLYRLNQPKITSVAKTSNTSVTVTWNKEICDGYEVQYSTDGKTWVKTPEVTGPYTVIDGLDLAKNQYVFRMRIERTNKDRGTTWSQYSDWAKVGTSVSEVPKLVAIYNSANGADIRWYNDGAYSSYVIMRKENGVWKEIKTVHAADLEENDGTYKYIDGEVKTKYGKGFIYSVAVKDKDGKLKYNTTGLALYRLAVPEIKSVKREVMDDHKATVEITWNEVDCHGYEVQISFDGGKTWDSIVETASTVARLKGLAHENDYIFRIRSQKTNADRGTTWSQYSSWKKLAKEAHSWIDATCTEPKTCKLCGKTEGGALGHKYYNGVCVRCGEDENATPHVDPGTVKLAVVYTALGDFWDKCGQGGTKRVEELKNEYPDWKVKLELTAASDGRVDSQIQVVENLIALGYQGICIAATDAERLTPTINKAVDAGMVVVTMDTDCPDSKRLCFIGTHNEHFGRKLAQFAIDWQEKFDDTARIIVLHGAVAQLGMIQRLKGIYDVVTENAGKGAELLDYQSPASAEAGQATVESMMLANPTWNSVICTHAGGSWVSAVFEENGWNDAATNPDHCGVLTDDTAQVINAVKDGFATVTQIQKQENWAYYAVDVMFKKIALGQYPDSDFIETPTFYVTIDNVYDSDMYPYRQ